MQTLTQSNGGGADILLDLGMAALSSTHIVAGMYSDILEDAFSIRIVVRERRRLIAENSPHWSEALNLVALGALLMVGVRDVNMQDLVFFLFLDQGESHLRAHDGHTYIYADGAFTIFSGVIPESLLAR